MDKADLHNRAPCMMLSQGEDIYCTPPTAKGELGVHCAQVLHIFFWLFVPRGQASFPQEWRETTTTTPPPPEPLATVF